MLPYSNKTDAIQSLFDPFICTLMWISLISLQRCVKTNIIFLPWNKKSSKWAVEGPNMLSAGIICVTMTITRLWKEWHFTNNRPCSDRKEREIWEHLTGQADTKIVWQTRGLEVFSSPRSSPAIWGIVSDICELISFVAGWDPLECSRF